MSYDAQQAAAALEVAGAQGKGELVRRGSFWTFASCGNRDVPGITIPTWYTTTEIIEGLVRRGAGYIARPGLFRVSGVGADGLVTESLDG